MTLTQLRYISALAREGHFGRAARACFVSQPTLSEAVRDRRRVRMRYRSYPSEETEREVDPYAVIHKEGYWYTVGYCHLRRGERLFRLDRVLEAEALPQTFERPPGFDTPERVLESLATMRENRFSVEVLLEASVGEARQQLPLIGTTLQEAPDGAIMRSSTSDLKWMARVLAGLDFPFVVKSPPELREALKRRAAEIADLAGREE
jgi:predicted DNA-binding transcriptional regulator YafY